MCRGAACVYPRPCSTATAVERSHSTGICLLPPGTRAGFPGRRAQRCASSHASPGCGCRRRGSTLCSLKGEEQGRKCSAGAALAAVLAPASAVAWAVALAAALAALAWGALWAVPAEGSAPPRHAVKRRSAHHTAQVRQWVGDRRASTCQTL